MEGVRVERVRHGQGAVHAHAGGAALWLYSGGWAHGVPCGRGVGLDARGEYAGAHADGARQGAGTLASASGDLARAVWAHGGRGAARPRPSLLAGAREYAEGAPHGAGAAGGELRFADGAVYVGALVRGAPGGGRGRYTAPGGAVLEGDWHAAWPVLHGAGSASAAGVTRAGTWRRGLLQGAGTEADAALGTYVGDFSRGLRHGFGTQRLRGAAAGVHCGAYAHGERAGFGVLDWTPADGGGKAPPRIF